MSRDPSDSFLPSGGIDSNLRNFSPDQMISPIAQMPRGQADYTSSSRDSPQTAFLQSRTDPQNRPPISPPKTRSASADSNTAQLVEDWRAYTHKLRMQNEGERAHMVADRARMEKVMADERALWDQERELLKARIAELEAQLEAQLEGGSKATSTLNEWNLTSIASHPNQIQSLERLVSGSSVSSVASSRQSVPQESGRNADGSPFYAPAPQNPSRTFDSSDSSDMTLDSIPAPREDATRVPSRGLTSSDFIQNPRSELASIPETPVETIDISVIQPELEGVHIKASAVAPEFTAKVLSLQLSPPKHSPTSVPAQPGAESGSKSRSRSSSPKDERKKENKRDTLEMVREPVDRRLTMHAGHTPNHSLSKFELLIKDDGGSGNSTPRQIHLHDTSLAQNDGGIDEEQEATVEIDEEEAVLKGQLGLTNDKDKDGVFLARLTEKLEEHRNSADNSPNGEEEEEAEDNHLKVIEQKTDNDEGPRLKLKPSLNFGKPMGSM